MKHPSLEGRSRFPLAGYVLINAGVWVVLALIYVATKRGLLSSVEPSVDRHGTAPVLVIIAICFLLASLYDYCFERVRPHLLKRRVEQQKPSKDDEGAESDAPKAAPGRPRGGSHP